jgi:hypothetical protein
VAAAGASPSCIASRQEGRDGTNRRRREREGERHKEREKGCHYWLYIQCLWKVIEGKHKFQPVYKEIDLIINCSTTLTLLEKKNNVDLNLLQTLSHIMCSTSPVILNS